MIEPERPAYDLTPQSLVWDVGSYRGDFSVGILEKFGCHVMAFDPMPAYYESTVKREVKRGFLEVHAFGLADRTYDREISLAGDRTSTHVLAATLPGYTPGPAIPCHFRDVVEFMDARTVGRVGLAKINIEGDEYALLRRLLDSGYIGRFGHLQVQFHTFVPDFGELYREIAEGLKPTHVLSWRKPWVWESWSRRPE